MKKKFVFYLLITVFDTVFLYFLLTFMGYDDFTYRENVLFQALATSVIISVVFEKLKIMAPKKTE